MRPRARLRCARDTRRRVCPPRLAHEQVERRLEHPRRATAAHHQLALPLLVILDRRTAQLGALVRPNIARALVVRFTLFCAWSADIFWVIPAPMPSNRAYTKTYLHYNLPLYPS
jgi:hypothetical protein